jgi:phage tail sheath protein FI
VSRLITVGPRTAVTATTSIGSLPITAVQTQVGAAGAVEADRLKQGIAALERASEPALVACPDALQLADELEQADVYNTMIGHAEKMRRFAVVDMPPTEDDEKLLNWRLTYLDSTYAAAYAPFARIVNPRRRPLKRVIEVPSSGFVMGVFARTDNERGVWKAPANERARGIVGLAVDYTRGRQDFLNPNAVNLLRSFPGRGIRIWGARNATTDRQWRYINVRRLFLFLENSIDGGTQWVVFEPNDASTWLRVRVSVENFLNQVWRAGGLAGATPEEAYRVRVGLGVTMTETDIDLGLLIIEVAAAPVKPAEFVVFRISHKRLTE